MKEILITSSALILAVLLLRRLFRSSISRRVQYAIWLLVLLRLLLPVQLPAAGYSVLSAAQPLQETVEAAARERVYLLPYAAYPTEFYTPEELPDRQPGAVFLEGEGSYGVVDGTGENVVFYRERVQPLQVLTFIWYFGMGVMALWFLGSNLRFARKLRRTRLPLQDVDSACPVYLCDDIPAPCLFGLLRPAIYVTSEAARDETRLRHVLAHEETHARHLDPLWSALRGLCLVLWWFDPLVWLAARCAKTDCELACDEGALARLGETERRAYGETLLALIPQRRSAHPLLAATSMTAGKRQMRDRITRIASRRRPALLALLAALALVCAACAVSFAGGEAGEEHADPDLSPAWEDMAASRPLTGDELAYFNEEFFAPYVLAEGERRINLHLQFLSSLYSAPEFIDLHELFYCGTGGAQQTLSPDEFDRVGTEACGTDKLPAEELDGAFFANTGLHLAETELRGLDRFPYLADYDAYYHSHGDTNYRGSVTMTAGRRQGDLVRLWYDDRYFGGGWKCVFLRAAGPDTWHFVANEVAEKPNVPTVFPEEEPWTSIDLDGLKSWEMQAVETVLHRDDCAERLGGWMARENVTVRWYETTGGETCAAVVDREGDEGWEARVFLTLPDVEAWNPNVTFFHDFFGCDGLIVFYSGRITGLPRQGGAMGVQCYFYTFADDGTPTLLTHVAAQDIESVYILDLDGDGTNELLTIGPRSTLLFERGGARYAADLNGLLEQALGGVDRLDEWYADVSRRTVTAVGMRGVHTIHRTLYFDGERLLVYREPDIAHTDHVLDGLSAPPEVLTAAKAWAEAKVRRLLEGEMGDAYSTWLDDWCLSFLRSHTTRREDYSIECWSLDWMAHTADPRQVMLAGGMHITEDNWVGGMYHEDAFLFFAVSADGTRQLLDGSAPYMCGPENEVLFPMTLAYIELRNGLRGPGDIGGVELWRMYRYRDGADTLNRLGAAGPEVCADALARMVEAAQRVDPEQLEWGFGLIGDSDALTEEGRAARELLRGLLEASEEA
ncbi:MAG: M56 family metallopeptidase [Oscillospiraceae bacterium]|nr:M56 family metallopeptidase [Oscillospiraceae bacterium]